jgi:hypothetical protein
MGSMDDQLNYQIRLWGLAGKAERKRVPNCLKEFTEQDLAFFKIIDVRDSNLHDLIRQEISRVTNGKMVSW